jgi:hypothetical protein
MGDPGTATAIAARPFSRRQFLAVSGGMAASYYALGPNRAHQDDGALGELVRAGGRALSVGYVSGSHAVGATGAAALRAGARVLPALHLRSGDASLHGAARIGVAGMTAGLGQAVAAGLSGVHVNALVPNPRLLEGGVLPFYAWSLQATPLLRTSPPVAFTAELERMPRLAFSLDVQGDHAGAGTGTAVFTTGRQSGMAKLRQGLYLLALGEGVWDRERVLPDPADDAAWAGLASLLVTVSAPEAAEAPEPAAD